MYITPRAALENDPHPTIPKTNIGLTILAPQKRMCDICVVTHRAIVIVS